MCRDIDGRRHIRKSCRPTREKPSEVSDDFRRNGVLAVGQLLHQFSAANPHSMSAKIERNGIVSVHRIDRRPLAPRRLDVGVRYRRGRDWRLRSVKDCKRRVRRSQNELPSERKVSLIEIEYSRIQNGDILVSICQQRDGVLCGCSARSKRISYRRVLLNPDLRRRLGNCHLDDAGVVSILDAKRA